MTKIVQTRFNFGSNFVVMFHYVRPIHGSLFPKIKGLEFKQFLLQLDLLQKYSNIVPFEEFMENLGLGYQSKNFKPMSLLTFDDGLKDHINFVLPELEKRKIKAIFFVPTLPLLGKPLKVQKIQFLIQEPKNLELIKNDIDKSIKSLDLDELLGRNVHANRLDSQPASKIKYYLQRGIPKENRETLVDELFFKYVGLDDDDFRKQLYMDLSDLRSLVCAGMDLGYHTENHCWFSDLDEAETISEVINPLKYFIDCGLTSDAFKATAYPFGNSTEMARELYLKNGVRWGFTTTPGSIPRSQMDRMLIPRWDTVDIPI